MNNDVKHILEIVDATIQARRNSLHAGQIDPTSYVVKLMQKGDDAILKKIGEEATEVVMAAKDCRSGSESDNLKQDLQAKLVGEVADLWFHSLVLLGHFQLSSNEVLHELMRREGMSGIAEKEARKSN